MYTEGWSEQKIDSSITKTGFKYVFKKEDTNYIAIAYPVELGELKHIYQNNLYMFDLIDTFEKKIVLYNSRECYEYKLPNKNLIDNDTFEFLWNDKK